MKTGLAIWTLNLEERDLLILRSTANLRNEAWTWVDAPESADFGLVDIARTADLQRIAALDKARLIVLAEAASLVQPDSFLHVLAKPLKAMQIMRLLDKLLAAPTAAPQPPPAVAAAMPPPAAGAGDTHPWRGRRLMFRRSPNLARYPVSAELYGWIELACRSAVPYEALLRELPEDVDMLHAILDDAARHGTLTDEAGTPLAPLQEQKPGAMSRFLKGFKS